MSFRLSWIAITLMVFLAMSWGDNKNQAAAKKIDEGGRISIIRALNGEMVYVRKAFPMGTKGLAIRPDGTVTPNDMEIQTAVAVNGPAAKPGERVRITNLIFRDKMIIFEINGGPVKKKKWYQRLEVGSAGGTRPVSVPSSELARGSFLAIEFDKFVPQITPEQLKERLAGVFDFNAKNTREAYLEAIPPKAKRAIQDHKVLVGMNREMVVYSVGQPERKIREKDGDVQYEEWIYGQPPAEVKFVRFVRDEVTRVETMQVDGQKVIDTAKQIDLKAPEQASAQPQQPAAPPPNAPTLRRPGEKPEVAVQPAPTGAETEGPVSGQPPIILSDPNAPGRPPKPPSEERVPQ